MEGARERYCPVAVQMGGNSADPSGWRAEGHRARDVWRRFRHPGTLYGKVVRSPHAHARIRSINTSKAEALPGVKAVITANDFPTRISSIIGSRAGRGQNFWHMTRNVMAREKALYEGHAVAAVAAISKAIAEEAASLIEIDYEVLPHVIDVDEAMKPDAPLLFEDRSPAASSRRRPSPRISLSGSNSRSAISTPALRKPTWSSRRNSRPRRCTRPISSRMPASPASTPTARPRSGRRARGIS